MAHLTLKTQVVAHLAEGVDLPKKTVVRSVWESARGCGCLREENVVHLPCGACKPSHRSAR